MRIAVTGGIAEGKSTVLGYVRDLGYAVASSDDIAKRIVNSPPVQAALGDLLGATPPISSSLLRKAIATSRDLRRAINHLTHPLILDALKKDPAQFIEVPLLVETCLYGLFDRTWVVTCGHTEQLRRLASRLANEAEAQALIDLQLPSEIKCAFADEIIRTNQPEAAVISLVRTTVTSEFGR